MFFQNVTSVLMILLFSLSTHAKQSNKHMPNKPPANKAPVANIGSTLASGFEPLFVSLSGLSSYDDDGIIIRYQWDFSDGVRLFGPFVSRYFYKAGSYTAKLTVFDNKGLSGTKSHVITVKKDLPPIAQYNFELQTAVGELNVKFDASGSYDNEGSVVEYFWDFNDPKTKMVYRGPEWLWGLFELLGLKKHSVVVQSYGNRPVEIHKYEKPGIYNVKLAVKDERGQWTWVQKSIEVADTSAPILTISEPQNNERIYVQSFPASIAVVGLSNEPLTSVNGNGVEFLRSSATTYSGAIQVLEQGPVSIVVSGKDRWNNEGVATVAMEVVNDFTAPVIGLAEYSPLTNQNTVPIEVILTEENPVTTNIFVNGTIVFSTEEKVFTAAVPLDLEGSNTIEITAIDAAKNEAVPVSFSITRDTKPPMLTFVSPVNDDYVDGISFQVKVSSNEGLKGNAKINDKSLSLGDGATQFQLNYTSSEEGLISLSAEATDLAGNTGSTQIQVTSLLKALNSSLVGLYPDVQNNKIIVKGAVGATRPFLTAKVSSSLFNSTSVQADKRGSFSVSLDPAVEYKISIYDPVKGDTFSKTLVYGADQDVILAGTVREYNNHPLVGATVSISGTNLVTTTDSSGVFQFMRSSFPNIKVTGDQQLVVDGSTALVPDDGVPRKFSRTTLAITIGVKQSNILQTPVYLVPTLLNGSATEVSVASGGTVTDINAPGTTLDIPAGAAQFPSGAAAESISLVSIPAEFATVAPVPEAMPKTVVALEPSGTTFSEPVQLTLPNSNSFPPLTEMVIMLMNSKTGKWEVGGSAVVSSDGQSVVTKENQGIRHFSLAYATIAGPNIRQIGAQDRPGADTFNGSVSSKIELPSFKSFGQNVVPNLVYKSSWAKPNAVITNLIDFPNKKVDVEPSTSYGSEVVKYSIDLVSCTYPATGFSVWCHKNPTEFYTNVQYETSYTNVTSEIQPEKVVASLKTGSLKTQEVEFKDLPHMANISFAVDLKEESNDSGFFASGIYPYQAHYNIHFKELVMGTSETKYWTNLTDAQTQSPEQFSQEYDRLFTQNLTDSLYVQNYRKSPAGRGWRIGGVQKILNPGGSKLVLEEADGGISTYSLKNTIQTVFDVGAKSGDVKSGVALNAWPSIAVASSSGNSVIGLTYDGSSVSSTNLGANYSVAGTLAGFDFYNYETQSCYQERYCSRRISGLGGNVCVEWAYRTICNNIPTSYCSKSSRSYSINAVTSQMIYLNGRVIGVDSARHSVFELNSNGAVRLLGAMQNASTFSNNYQVQAASHIANINQFCSSTSGINCGAISTTTTTPASYNACGTPPSSSGQVAIAGGSVVGGYQALNSPMGITASPWNDIVVIADTGNHKVRWLNVLTKETGVIAGNGTAMDLGDGGAATTASLQHPQGVTYDTIGNLYISTKSGYIRKVDTNGNISTLAGNPINGKLASEVQAADALFNKPYGLAVDSKKNLLYVADSGHNRIVAINLISGIATTVAGTGSGSSSGDGGSALEAGISGPTLLGLDTDGNLLVTDTGANSVRRIVFQVSSLGALAYAPTAEDHSEVKKQSDGTFVRTFRNGARAFFDSSGRQYAEQDKLGRTAQYSYDSQNRLVKVTLPTSQEIAYNYSGERLGAIVDPAGRTTTFSYGWNGDLTQVDFPDGSSKRYEYDSDGLMTAEIDQAGGRSRYVYNAQSRIAKVIAPDGSESIINDSVSQDLESYSSSGANTPSSISSLSNSIQDANGNVTEVAKDFQGYISNITDAKGNRTIIKRDIKGRAIEIKDAAGDVVKNTYNTYGDLVRIEDVSTGIVEEKEFDSLGNIVKTIDGKGNISLHNFNPLTGLLVSDVASNGMTVNYHYNSLGLVTSKTVSGGGQSQTLAYEYNGAGNLIKQIQPDGKFTNYDVDAAGNVVRAISQVDGSTQSVTQYVHDRFNRLISVTSPRGEVTRYGYSAFGDLTSIKDPANGESFFEYDSRRRLVRKVDSVGGVYAFAYDGNGNVVRETDPKGQNRIYSYDELNNLIQAQFPDDLVNYVYNQKNEVVQVSNNTSVVSYVRDSKNRVIQSLTSGVGSMSSYPAITLNHSYDENGNRILMSSSAGSIGYAYDVLNRLTALQNSTGDIFSFSYDGVGRLRSMTRPAGSTDYSYTGNSVSSIIHSSGGTTNAFSEYQYDERNFPISKRSPAGQVSYGYDSNGQLVGASGIGEAEAFTYDALGNRIVDHNGNLSYDSTGQRLAEDWQYRYQYDANGNLVQKIPKDPSKHGFLYSYSSKNQLTEIRVTDGPLGQVIKQIGFVYDVLGRRMQKTVWDRDNSADITKTYTRRFVYDGDNVLFEYDGNNSLLARYTHSPLMPDDILSAEISSSGQSAGLAQSVGKYYYLKDALGSVTDITNSSGEIVQRYDYESFGKIRSVKDAIGNDIASSPLVKTSFTFTGREWDEESGLYYYRARYYDPNIGRFIQRDPHPGVIGQPVTHNSKFIYGNNSPTNFVDPSGQLAWFIAIPLMSALAGAISGGIFAAIQGGDILAAIGSGAIGGLVTGTGAVVGIWAAGGVAAIGTTAGMLGGALGGGLSGGLFGALTGGGIESIVLGMVGGGLGGLVAGAVAMPFMTDLTVGVKLSTPQITPPPPTYMPPTPPPQQPIPIGGLR